MKVSTMNSVEVEAGRLSRMRRVWNSLCGDSARECMRQIKELLSSCKGQVEIGQHEFILVCSVLPVAVFWDLGSRKGEGDSGGKDPGNSNSESGVRVVWKGVISV